MSHRKMMLSLSIDALFLAIIAMFAFVPYLGFITVGPISFTTLHIFVLIGAMLFGKGKGALYGFFMGFISLLVCLQYPGTVNYLFINPFVSILPRVLFGFFAGCLFDYFRKRTTFKSFFAISAVLAGALTLFHTFLTLSCLYVFSYLDIFKISELMGMTDIIKANESAFGSFGNFILAFIAPGTVCEVAASIVLTPSIVSVLNKVLEKSRYSKLGLIEEFGTKEKLFTFKTNAIITTCISIFTVALCVTVLCLFYIK